jgi:hypothetical protein
MSISEMGGFCNGCVLGKAHRKPFTPRLDRAQVVSELISTDVNGPLSLESLLGSKYHVQYVLLQQVSHGVHQTKE